MWLIMQGFIWVSTHSRAEAAANHINCRIVSCSVSTHSRAEAAALSLLDIDSEILCFNTQPRGGGCPTIHHARK